jgi:hypothetical protein
MWVAQPSARFRGGGGVFRLTRGASGAPAADGPRLARMGCALVVGRALGRGVVWEVGGEQIKLS